MSSSVIVQKLWNYCNVLRDDGMSYLLARNLTASDLAQEGTQASGDYPSTLHKTGPSVCLRTGSEQLTYLFKHGFRREP